MNKWVEYYLNKQDDPRERRGRKVATANTGYRELVLHRWFPSDPTLRKAQALQWFAEFSEGVIGWVPEPSPLVINALIDAVEQWLEAPTRTA